jgi:hypothetical protein
LDEVRNEELIGGFSSHGGFSHGLMTMIWGHPILGDHQMAISRSISLILYSGEMHRVSLVYDECIVKMIFDLKDGDEFFASGHATLTKMYNILVVFFHASYWDWVFYQNPLPPNIQVCLRETTIPPNLMVCHHLHN